MVGILFGHANQSKKNTNWNKFIIFVIVADFL